MTITEKVREFWADLTPDVKVPDGYCQCPEPVTDDEAGARSTGDPDPDFCWMCRREVAS